jgi:putative ABC transport system ATP-binding protein
MSLVELKGASKTYGRNNGVEALKPTSLNIEVGEYVAIIGKSGSGKTTLLNLIAGLDHPTAGAVLVDGRDIGRLKENGRARWRAQSLGIVFQFFQLLPTITTLDNILLAMSLNPRSPARGRSKRARALLELVGMAGEAERFPPTLSGGQQQRAAIARALSNDPELLVLDEPTGSIDSDSTEGLLRVLDELHARGRTLVVVTHDPDVAARAVRRIKLHDGMVVSDSRKAS